MTRNGINGPGGANGPPAQNLLHLNNVYADKRGIFASGMRTEGILHIGNENAVSKMVDMPQGMHNARPFRDGVLFNDTGSDVVRYVGRDGTQRASRCLFTILPNSSTRNWLTAIGAPGFRAGPVRDQRAHHRGRVFPFHRHPVRPGRGQRDHAGQFLDGRPQRHPWPGSLALLRRCRAYDAIVVGAGHNGLTTAFYLAKARLNTLVLERRDVVGGCAVTEEIDPQNAPGCRVSTAAYMASMLRPEVIRDMQLARHGLKMIAADPGLQIALPEGRVLPWWSDERKTHAELSRFSRKDADTFFRVDQDLKKLARYLQPFFLEPPPRTEATGLAGLLEVVRVGRRFRGLNGRQISELTTFLTGSLEQFLDRYFESEEIKRLILANNLYGKHGGPRDPGSAMGLLFHLLSGGEDEQQGFSGHVIGGMGAITQAMAAACTEAGVEIRTGAEVERIESVNGRASGVTAGQR